MGVGVGVGMRGGNRIGFDVWILLGFGEGSRIRMILLSHAWS